MDTFSLDLTINTASRPNNVYSTELGTPVLESGSESIPNADRVYSIEIDPAVEISNLDSAQSMKVVFYFFLVSISSKNTGRSVPTCNFRSNNYWSGDIFANLDQITEVSYTLREVVDGCKQNHWIIFRRNRLEYNSDVLTVTFCSILEGHKTLIEILPLDDSVREH